MDLPTETRGHIEQRLAALEDMVDKLWRAQLEARIAELWKALHPLVETPPPPPQPDEPDFDLPEKSA